MKIFLFDNSLSLGNVPAWQNISDSSLSNAGKPFYIPDFAQRFEAFPVLVVKIDRMGKSVSSKFAHRYFNKMAPAILFRATDLYEKLLSNGLPTDMASNFDRAIICGEFADKETLTSQPLVFTKNGQALYSFNLADIHGRIHSCIEAAGKANILKMGDLIIPSLPFSSPVEEGDKLSISNSAPILEVAVK